MDAAMTEQQRRIIFVAQSAAANAADEAQAMKCVWPHRYKQMESLLLLLMLFVCRLVTSAQAAVDRQLTDGQRTRVAKFQSAMAALQALR